VPGQLGRVVPQTDQCGEVDVDEHLRLHRPTTQLPTEQEIGEHVGPQLIHRPLIPGIP